METENKPANEQQYVQRSLEVVIKVGLAIGLVMWCFMIIKPFLMITLWSVILSVAVYPLFRWLRDALGNRRILASVIVTIALLLVIIIPIILLGGSLAEAVTYVKDKLMEGNNIVPPPSEEVKSWPVIGKQLHHLWDNAYRNLADFAMDYRAQILAGFSWFFSALTNAGMGLLMLLISIIVSGVLLIYAGQGGDAARRIAIRLMGAKGEEIIANAETTVRNVMRGILGVAFIQAFLVGVGFLVAGVPGAGLWALISFVLAIVQIGVGPVVLGVLIYAWIQMSTLTAILLTIYCILPLTIDNVLKPLLLGRKAPAPMLVVFLGAIGGFISFGTIGLFVGAVVLSLGYDLFLVWLRGE